MRRLLAAAPWLVAGAALAASEEAEHGGGGGSLIEPQFGLIFWTVVTFVILLFVLSRVAWRPLLTAVEERERRIRSEIGDARKQRDEAEQLLAEHRRLVDEARRETAEIVAQGQKDAARLVEEAQQKARGESERLLEQARRQIAQETRSAMGQVRGTVVDLALAAAGRLLGRSVDDSANRDLVDRYVSEIERLPGSDDSSRPS